MPKLLFSQRGDTSSVLIIIVLVIIFGVMLSGGSSRLLSGNIPSSVTTTPTPSVYPSISTAPTLSPTTAPVDTWSIDVTLDKCSTQNGQKVLTGNATAKGSDKGYIAVELQDQNGNFTQDDSTSFSSNQVKYQLNIIQSHGFDKSKWRVSLYSGGSENNGIWSGGTLKASKDESPISC